MKKGLKVIILFLAAGAIVFVLLSGMIMEIELAILGKGSESGTATASASTAGTGNSALSENVLKYQDAVLAEAKQHGKEEYLNLFLAVMEQESHGAGSDVFQSSESKGLPAGTLSPAESIKQGVAYLSAMIDKAGVTSPSDLERIRLALQGYNMSGGYIDYAVKSDGKWTQENVFAYAKMKSGGVRNTGNREQVLGPWRYGDQYYTQHVLRYYQIPGTESGGTASADETEAIGIALNDRMGWLFPDGTPKSSGAMQPYLTQISVPIINESGKETAMTLTVHKKLTANISGAFADMKKAGFQVIASQTAGYNWRMMASNSSKVSYHSYGCVVDLNWGHNGASYTGWPYNPGKDPYAVTTEIVQIWKNHGFYWGGDWSERYFDPMHFTYVNH